MNTLILQRLLPLFSVFVLFFSQPATAAPQDCIENGGLADCTQPELTPYTYNLCDEAGSFIFRQRLHCTVWKEGDWVVYPSGPRCENTNPDALQDGTLMSKAIEFERRAHSACATPEATDSGWLAAGQQISSYNCWSGGPAYRNGIEILGLRKFDVSGETKDSDGACSGVEWSEAVIARRDRRLVCPVGYLQRTVNGRTECYKVPEDCPTVGNPVLPASGGKRQTEVDYVPSGNGVLRFERTFYSYGYYRPFGMTKDRPDSMVGQYWRSNYDRRIYPAPTGASYLVSMIRPDGTIRHFDLSGNEVLTQGKFRRRLTQNASGWLYVNSDNEQERYTPEGLLQSITDVRGIEITLTYSDEDTPPEIAPQPGLLIRAASSLGREFAFVYYPSGLLKTLSAPGGLTYIYSYDARENLAKVLLAGPDGASETRRYHYENTNFPRLLTGITDQNGQRFATYAYDASGRTILSEHQGGALKYTFVYRTEGSDAITEVTDPLGKVRIYRYRTIDGVRRNVGTSTPCESCGGNAESTTYDANGFVTSRIDFNGNMTTYQHNARGLEISRTEAAGTPEARTITTEWHPVLRLPTKITEPGKITEYTYDANGNRLSETVTDITGLCADGQGNGCVRTTTYTYNSRGLLLTIDGPRTDVNDTTTFEYDDQGNRISIANALNQVIRISDYDAYGNPLAMIDPNGVRTELRYDLRQRLITRTVAAGTADEATTHFEYDAAGNLIKILQPNGSFLKHHYDTAHRLIAIEDSEGNRIDYTLDAAGNRTAEITHDPDGMLVRTQSTVYNKLGRMIEQLGADNQRTAYEYDGNGNIIRITDPKGQITIQGFDALNRLIRIEDPANGADAPTRYEYDGQGNLTKATNPKGLATEYHYNGFGELILQTSPDTQTSAYQYDQAGNRIAQTNARGITVHYRYDAINRPIASDYPGIEEDIEYI